jgi:hypothetical protein
VVRRHGDFTRSIHLRHLPQKLQTMIRPTFQHIELPLMDHFMSQSVEQLLLRVRCPIGELFKEWERKSNLTMTASHSERMECLGTFTTGNIPTEAVRRWLHTISIGMSESAKYRVFKCRQ